MSNGVNGFLGDTPVRVIIKLLILSVAVGFLMSIFGLYPDDMRVKRAFQTTKLFYPGFDETRASELCRRFGLDARKKITALSTGYTSIFRLITARRNPNLLLLSAATLVGRPDIGLIAVGVWTALCLVVHAVQIVQGLGARRPLVSWLEG